MAEKKHKKDNKSGENIIFISIGIFAFTFFIYIMTLYPSLSPVADSAELVTNGYLLGINHPPGYPLYTMLSYIFTHIPAGNIPFRLNIMSAFFSSLSNVIIFLLGYVIFKNKIVSAVISLLHGFSYTLWKLSTCGEVFTLNVFISLAMIFFLILWRDRTIKQLNSNYLFYIFSLFAGLGLAHHHTVVLLIPAFIYLMLVTDKKVFTDRRLVISFFLVISGLVLYIYLPLRAHSSPLNWGASGFVGVIEIITRKRYGSTSIHEGLWTLDSYMKNIWIYLASLSWQLTVILVPLIFLGIYYSLKKERNMFIFFLLILIFSGPVFIAMGNPPQEEGWKWLFERFYLPSVISIVFFAGYGIQFLAGRFRYLYFCSFILCLLPLCYNYHKVDNNYNYVYYDYSKNLLTSLPRNSILLCFTDLAGMGTFYLQNVEHVRPDVKVFQYGLLGSPWYIKQMSNKYPDIFSLDFPYDKEKVMDIILRKKNAYVDIPVKPLAKDLTCCGLYYSFGDKMSSRSYIELLDGGYKIRSKLDIRLYNDYFTKELLRYYALSYHNMGTIFQKEFLYKEAEDSYLKSIEIYPLPETYTELGLLYKKENKLDKAEELFSKNSDFDSFFNLAIIYLLKGELEKSEETFNKCIDINPDNPLIYSNLAILYDKRGDLDRASESIEKALKINSTMADLYYNLAIIKIKQGKLSEGEDNLKKALKYGFPEKDVIKTLNFIHNRN